MKESTLIELKNKVETLGKLTQGLIMELNNIRTLAVGTFETLKLMDGYDTAIAELTKPKVEEGKIDA